MIRLLGSPVSSPSPDGARVGVAKVEIVRASGPHGLACRAPLWEGDAVCEGGARIAPQSTLVRGLQEAGDRKGHGARYLAAWCEGMPVASAAVFIAGSHAAIEHFVTSKERRGRGIGTLPALLY